MFSALGSHVTLFNRSNTLLRGFDQDISSRFTEVFGQRVELQLGHVPTKVERTADGIVITCAGEEIVVDELLVATGREPNSDLLDVDAGGLECHHHGTVAVDDTMATTVPASGRSVTSRTAISSSIWRMPRRRSRSGTSLTPTTSATRATRRSRARCSPIRRSPPSA